MSDSKTKPAVIIIGVPDLAHLVASSVFTLRCCDCRERFKVTGKLSMTVAQLGDTCPPVVCYGCYQRAAAKIAGLPQVDLSAAAEAGEISSEAARKALPPEVTGINEARARMGLEN